MRRRPDLTWPLGGKARQTYVLIARGVRGRIQGAPLWPRAPPRHHAPRAIEIGPNLVGQGRLYRVVPVKSSDMSDFPWLQEARLLHACFVR